MSSNGMICQLRLVYTCSDCRVTMQSVHSFKPSTAKKGHHMDAHHEFVKHASEFVRNNYPGLEATEVIMPLTDGREIRLPISAAQSSDNTSAINERMLGVLHADPSAIAWSARAWAGRLKCSCGTIARTHAWTVVIRGARALEQSQRNSHP